MRYEWDDDKAESNLAKHGVAFSDVVRFDWSDVDEIDDKRFDYGETRTNVVGFLDGRLHVLLYTPRDGAKRLITLRKANPREVLRYERRRTEASAAGLRGKPGADG
jgi:uncharacterized DUF497 family protein